MFDLSDRQPLEWLAQLVADIRTAAPEAKPLLVGALSRDLLLHYVHGFKIERATTDVDFALAVASWEQFSTTRDALLSSGLFSPYRNTVHKLQHAKFGWVDLIPFGAVEERDGTIAWPPAGEEVMDVIGYTEAAATASTVSLPKHQTVRVISLPMLAVLKLLAWRDRHRFTHGKDAKDLQLILCRYLEAGNLDRLYAEFPHVITDTFDFEPTGAWLLGRDAREGLQKHSLRFDQVMAVLDEIIAPELEAEGKLTLVLQLAPNDADSALKLLTAFHAGLNGSHAP